MEKISKDVVACLEILEEKRSAALRYDHSSYQMDRIELTMDYILNHPLKEGDPQTIVNNAWGSAGKKLRGRIKQTQKLSDLSGVDCIQQHSSDEEGHLRLEHLDSLRRSKLKTTNQEILADLTRGLDAETIALKNGSSIGQVRTRISRARALYKTELLKDAI